MSRPAAGARLRTAGACLILGLVSAACATSPVPPPVTQAQAVADSPAVAEAEQLAPQATAAARRLVQEAEALYEQGEAEAAGITAEQAIAAFEEAFTLARAARAQERLEKAERELAAAEKRLVALDAKQEQLARDADAFELRARVALDKEELADVDSMSPDRARARRRAAIQLAAEARTLCLAAHLLGASADSLKKAEAPLQELQEHLDQGSARADVYPRAARARSTCLGLLTAARQPRVREEPAAGHGDRLLEALTETGKLFAFRDDRGVVVNIAEPVASGGELTSNARNLAQLLGGTSKAHPDFPVLIVAHSAGRTDEADAQRQAQSFKRALESAGAGEVTVLSAGDSQPVVDQRVRGADERNSRLEVIFVSPGR